MTYSTNKGQEWIDFKVVEVAREDFEKYVTENREKYPDIIWTHDAAERSDERASKRLYGVMGIPTQFVIDRSGEVVQMVLGYTEGDVVVDAALAKAGIEVDPDIVAQGTAQAQEREQRQNQGS